MTPATDRPVPAARRSTAEQPFMLRKTAWPWSDNATVETRASGTTCVRRARETTRFSILPSPMTRLLVALALFWSTLVGAQRPNIVYIMSDDHAAHAIGAYGSRGKRTPHIDRPAREVFPHERGHDVQPL